MNAWLTERRPPWVVLTDRGDPRMAAESAELVARGGRVFRLDGRQLVTQEAVFAAFADELSFPGYFGRNWDALCQAAWQANLRLDGDAMPQDLAAFALHFVLLLDETPPAAFAPAVASGMDVRVALDAGRLTATLSSEDRPTPPDPPRPGASAVTAPELPAPRPERHL
ncbi:barstar (barnase inhibitor) [Streptomyces sp. TLI_55]|uniref:barstar family protein n=1 Tax=Streptomyces sp. TLI_55 TaxID=1938861 RepID=UPI000BC447E2|nr:barstar family protein [Streptomyces sp. TLI_55]SNX56603.1 barstar (barnase inhibitor) [Streptomyces sp. TLI_55]